MKADGDAAIRPYRIGSSSGSRSRPCRSSTATGSGPVDGRDPVAWAERGRGRRAALRGRHVPRACSWHPPPYAAPAHHASRCRPVSARGGSVPPPRIRRPRIRSPRVPPPLDRSGRRVKGVHACRVRRSGDGGFRGGRPVVSAVLQDELTGMLRGGRDGDGVRYIRAAERRARLALRQRLAGTARAGARRRSPARWSRCTARIRRRCTWPWARGSLTPAKTAAGDRAGAVRGPVPGPYARHAAHRLRVPHGPHRGRALLDRPHGRRPGAGRTAQGHGEGRGAGRGWLKEVEESALAALARRGQATAAELAGTNHGCASSFVYGGREELRGTHTVSTQLLRVLGVEGKVVRGRPYGLVDVQPVPLGSGTRASRAGRGRGAGGAARAVARGVRARPRRTT